MEGVMKVKLNTIFKVFLTVLCVLFFTVNYSAAQIIECSRVPLQLAIDVMAGDAEVTVTTVTVPEWVTGKAFDPNYYYEFEPVSSVPTEALIIYPGALVDARAYAPMARDIAALGYAGKWIGRPALRRAPIS